MVNAKVFGTNPRAIAAALVENMSFDGTFFDRAEIAGPGFMNFFLNNSYFETVVKAVLEIRTTTAKPTTATVKGSMLNSYPPTPQGLCIWATPEAAH